MRRRAGNRDQSLARLRAGFIGLGLLLLLPLAMLLGEAEARFEEQRRLRHEIVAERIFDEMERELTLLLENEGARPSSAYEATHTQVESWSPWVVGYFSFDGTKVHLPGREQLADARAARVQRSIEGLSQQGALARLMAGEDATAGDRDSRTAAPTDPQQEGQDAKASSVRSFGAQEQVLRQLNRAAMEREQKKKKKKRPARSKSKWKVSGGLDDDPLEGLSF